MISVDQKNVISGIRRVQVECAMDGVHGDNWSVSQSFLECWESAAIAVSVASVSISRPNGVRSDHRAIAGLPYSINSASGMVAELRRGPTPINVLSLTSEDTLFRCGGMAIFAVIGMDGAIMDRYESYPMHSLDAKTGQFDRSKAIPRSRDEYDAEAKKLQGDVMAERDRCVLAVESLIGTCVQGGDARDEVLREAIDLIQQGAGPRAAAGNSSPK